MRLASESVTPKRRLRLASIRRSSSGGVWKDHSDRAAVLRIWKRGRPRGKSSLRGPGEAVGKGVGQRQSGKGSRVKAVGHRQSGKGSRAQAGGALPEHHFGEKLVVEEHVERRGISDLLRVGHLRLMAPPTVMSDAAIGRLCARHRILGGTVIKSLADVMRRLGSALGCETRAPVGGRVAGEVVVSAEGGDVVRPGEEPAIVIREAISGHQEEPASGSAPLRRQSVAIEEAISGARSVAIQVASREAIICLSSDKGGN